MAIQNFIDGALYGKVGGFVGANWRGVDYMRAYTKPKQPDSPAQVLHKQNFRRLITIANVLHKIWFPLVFEDKPNKTLSNQFMTLNKDIYKTDGKSYIAQMPYNNSRSPILVSETSSSQTGCTLQFRLRTGYTYEGNIKGLLVFIVFEDPYMIIPAVSTELNKDVYLECGENWQQKRNYIFVQLVTDAYIYKPLTYSYRA